MVGQSRIAEPISIRQPVRIETVTDFRRMRFGLLATCIPCHRFVDLDLGRLPDDATMAALSRAIRCETCGELGRVSLTGPRHKPVAENVSGR